MIVEAALLFHVAAFLCDTAQTAILFEDLISEQRDEELAADDLARREGRQVCGYYAGQAAVGSQTRVIFHGVVYLLTEYVFDEDHRTAVSAQRVFDAGGGGGAHDL